MINVIAWALGRIQFEVKTSYARGLSGGPLVIQPRPPEEMAEERRRRQEAEGERDVRRVPVNGIDYLDPGRMR